MASPIDPHMTWPLHRDPLTGKVFVVEQDSPPAIQSCELAITLCPAGYRPDFPAFGWVQPNMRQIPLDPTPLLTALNTFEGRVKGRTATEAQRALDAASRIITVTSPVTSQGGSGV